MAAGLTLATAATALRDFPLIGSRRKKNSLHPQPTHPSFLAFIHPFIENLQRGRGH